MSKRTGRGFWRVLQIRRREREARIYARAASAIAAGWPPAPETVPAASPENPPSPPVGEVVAYYRDGEAMVEIAPGQYVSAKFYGSNNSGESK